MTAARLPVDEAARLRPLHALDVLDSASDPVVDALVRVAAAICGAPISLVSLIDADRQWVTAGVGHGDLTEPLREQAFCAHAILEGELLEVPDLRNDARFADNPFVTEAGLRFYAAAPLQMSDGARIGALCVLDQVPRQLDLVQRELLRLLAVVAVKALESRQTLVRLNRAIEVSNQNEAMFRTLSATSPVGVFQEDAAGVCVYVNDRYQEIFGLSLAECVGRGWAEAVHPDDLPGVLAAFGPAGATELELRQVFRVRRRDGSVRSVQVKRRPVPGANGRPSGYVGTVDDVTEHQAALQRLASDERHLRWLYEATPAMLHSIDAEGRIVTVSDRWLARLGYAREEVIGRPAADFAFRPDDDAARRLAKLQADGHFDDLPVQMVTRAGVCVETRVSAAVKRDAQGVPLRGVAVLDDVTERLSAERVIREERWRLASIIDATGAGTWEWNAETGELKVNERWGGMLGLTEHELGPVSQSSWRAHAHPDDLPRVDQQMRAHLRGETPAYEVELRMRHREDHWVWVLSRGRLLTRTPAGAPEWMFGTHIDLTSRKQQEEALRQSERFLERTSQIVGIGGWEFDRATGVMYWSDPVCRMLDREPGYQPVTDDIRQACTPTSLALLDAAASQMQRDQSGWDLELEVTTCRGRKIWVRTVAEIEPGGSGRSERVVGALQDVTSLVLQRHAVEQAKERLRVATDSGGIGIWEFDVQQMLMSFDALACTTYGLPGPAATLAYDEWLACVHEEDRAAIVAAATAAIRSKAPLDSEFRILHPDGSLRHVRATARSAPDDGGGHTRRLIGANWDITALRLLGAELAQQHELMRVTLQSIGDAVITTDAAGQVTWLNPIAERMTGWGSDEARARPIGDVFQLVDEATGLPAPNPVADCLERGGAGRRDEPSVMVSRDGSHYGVEDSAAPIRNEHGEVFGAVLVFRDVTEKRRLSAEMSHRAIHDALTGLVNRSEFEVRLGRLLEKTRTDASEHTLLFVDLDQFKLVNDACGHSVGDQLLQQVSRLLEQSVRSRDTVARLGGDEFGIIVEHCTAEQAERAAQSICDRMNDFRFEHGGKRFRVGTSIGLVPLDARWATTAALIQAADTSCYAAKEAGRNRIHIWFDTDAAMRARHGEMKWATRLEQALDDNRFVLFAQRIEPIGNRGTSGVHAEVLLRLQEADGSLVAPGAFLPAAERFHLSSRIDRWVLGAACDRLVALPDLSPIDMLCVNLSGQSIGDRVFHRHALELLSAAGAAVCKRLCLEITETAAVTNLADAASFIEQARLLGAQIALDDFGAGASSFGYLKKLRVDLLKIDGQFIRDFLDDPLDAAAVRCFVDVARVMGLKTVAEFVDRPEVLERLGAIGVDYAQGYLLHRPEPLDNVIGAVPLSAGAQVRPGLQTVP